jgi:hypothetical protein
MYGPLSDQEAKKVMGPAPRGPTASDWYQHGDELYLVYENDGARIVPNFARAPTSAEPLPFTSI